MTAKDLRDALDHIEAQQPGVVHAGRKGICVGFKGRGYTIMFRKIDGMIRAELWTNDRSSGPVASEELSADLAARAANLIAR